MGKEYKSLKEYYLDALYEQPFERERKKQRQTARPTKTAEPELGVGADAFRKWSTGQQTGAGELARAKAKRAPELRQAGVAKTRQAVSGLQPDENVIKYVSAAMLSGKKDILSDEEVLRQLETEGITPMPVKPQNLPAVINKSIAKLKGIEPEWHMVKHLPGYLQEPIRAIGREVFAPFTKTPIEQIQVLADLQGQGPNHKTEINAVASWLKQNAIRDMEGEVQFTEIFEGYEAEVKMYNAVGYSFLLVKDFMGNYIYSWPGGRGVQLGATERKRLPEAYLRLWNDLQEVLEEQQYQQSFWKLGQEQSGGFLNKAKSKTFRDQIANAIRHTGRLYAKAKINRVNQTYDWYPELSAKEKWFGIEVMSYDASKGGERLHREGKAPHWYRQRKFESYHQAITQTDLMLKDKFSVTPEVTKGTTKGSDDPEQPGYHIGFTKYSYGDKAAVVVYDSFEGYGTVFLVSIHYKEQRR